MSASSTTTTIDRLRASVVGAVRDGRRRARQVARRARGDNAVPLLSVVVPFRDEARSLRDCVDSLLAQTEVHLEVLLVSDGADDASLEVAERLATRGSGVHLLRQRARGVGAARNRGVRAATGDLLAFCDADDVIPPQALQQLVSAVVESGSDFAMGSASVQRRGRHQVPDWAAVSNPSWRLGATLEDHPAVLAHPIIGGRVFRREWWAQAALSFDTATPYPDAPLLVQMALEAAAFDVLPILSYRCLERTDGRRLIDEALREPERARALVASWGQALARLEGHPQGVRDAWFTGTLAESVRDLARAGVVRRSAYWQELSTGMRVLTAHLTRDDWVALPFQERVVTWLCARGDLALAEDFLEYGYENPFGYPSRIVDGMPVVELELLQGLHDVPEGLTRVTEAELRFHTRLSTVRWAEPGVLEIGGVAFVDHLTHQFAPRTVLELVDQDGRTVEVVAEPKLTAPDTNLWAQRAHEDVSGAAFSARLPLADLPEPGADHETVYRVTVRHEVGGHVRRSGFEQRRREWSAGLLEAGGSSSTELEPRWDPYEGLALVHRVRDVPWVEKGDADAVAGLFVRAVKAHGDVLEITGISRGATEVALHGPRVRTGWHPLLEVHDEYSARVPLTLDEWGKGALELPTDRYHLVFRDESGRVKRARLHRTYWAQLPQRVRAGDLNVMPEATPRGTLKLRITAWEWVQTEHPYSRQRMRTEVYERALERPLRRDTALFSAFAGRAGGDQPGSISRELLNERPDLDAVLVVADRSVLVPEGVRAVVRFTEEHIDLLARAQYVVTNTSLPYFFRRRPEQVVVQTWHGSPLKRIGHDRFEVDFANWHHRRQLLQGVQEWDFLVSQSPFCTEKLRSAFRYQGPVLESGYPRNDILSAPDRDALALELRLRLGIDPGQRVVLYAPTWRDMERSGQVWHKVLYLDAERVAEELDCVVLVRGHYNSMKNAEESQPDPRVRDLTRYPDIAELFLVADAFVTDYSSAFFDFATVDKPMIFLAPDLVSYRDESRGLYVDYHSTVPGPVCETTEEVIALLRGPDAESARRGAFRQQFVPWDDGHASERVVEAMLRLGEERLRS